MFYYLPGPVPDDIDYLTVRTSVRINDYEASYQHGRVNVVLNITTPEFNDSHRVTVQTARPSVERMLPKTTVKITPDVASRPG